MCCSQLGKQRRVEWLGEASVGDRGLDTLLVKEIGLTPERIATDVVAALAVPRVLRSA